MAVINAGVVAVVVATRNGGSSTPSAPPSVVASSSAVPAAALAAVEGLKANQPRWSADPDSWKVQLSWQGSDGADHYVVTRDGKELGDSVDGTSFTDSGVVPEQGYTYTVQAVDVSGAGSKPARAHLNTGKLPTEDGRLDGRWILQLHVVSSNVGAHGGALRFVFTPTCKAGACDARWSISGRASTGTLNRSGARYSGHASTPFLIRSCSGGTINDSVDVDLRVTTAHYARHAWLATKLEGTIHESAPAAGCVTGSDTFKVTGTLG